MIISSATTFSPSSFPFISLSPSLIVVATAVIIVVVVIIIIIIIIGGGGDGGGGGGGISYPSNALHADRDVLLLLLQIALKQQ